MPMISTDTIFAVATPPGRSAIAVIRISGPQARLAPALFGANCPDAGRFLVTRLRAEAGVIDEAVILFMEGPRSSTGEDVCEIHCHGSSAVLGTLTNMLADARGFRLAEHGEFTRRAFMNDKMDLLGVEGLADLIDAETPVQLHQAWAQIDGALRGPVGRWREALIAVASRLEALIDFADEDLPDRVEADLRQHTQSLITDIAGILNDNRAGELVRDGVTIALVGPVNAGKSTILNGLAGRSAAIVSDQAGTTRDIISVRLDLAGVPVTILDTAGVRDTDGVIEAEGIRRTIAAAQHADLLVFVVDASATDWPADFDSLTVKLGNPALMILNKADKGLRDTAPKDAFLMSAQNDADLLQLMTRLGAIVRPLNTAQHSAIITRARHRRALRDAHDALIAGLDKDLHTAPELAAEDYRQAVAALGRITGDVDVEELLGQIFSSFCIGK